MAAISATRAAVVRCIIISMFHRAARIMLEGLAILAFVAVAGVALAAWRFSQGPISVGFLKPVLDGAVEQAVPGYKVDIADTVLVWTGWDNGVDIRARGLQINGPSGGKVAEFAEATIRLSGIALLRGQIAPATIEVSGPVLKLERGEDGIVRFAGQGEDALTLGQALSPRGDDGAGGDVLREITISGAEVEFTEVASRSVWRARDANVVLSRRQGVTRLDADLQLLYRERATRLTIQALQERGVPRIAASIGFEEVGMDLFAALMADGERLSGLVLPLGGKLELGLDSGGRLLDAALRVTSRGGSYTDAGLFPAPVVVKSLLAHARYDPAQRRAEIENLTVAIEGGGSVDLRATAGLNEGAIEVTGRARARRVPIDSFAGLWPLPVARKARLWVTANLSDGHAEEGQFDFALGGAEIAKLKATRLDGVVRFQGVSVNYLNPMPRVRSVSGTATLGLTRIDIASDTGTVGNLRVEDAKVALTKLDTNGETADIQITVRGPVRDQVQLIDSPPLGFMKNVGLNPADFAGDGVTRAHFEFPLVQGLKVEQIAVGGTVETKGFALKRAALGQDARDGDLTMKFDEKGLNATGKLTIGRTPAEVDYSLGFLASNPIRERIKASGRLPEGELARFGFDFAPYLEGPLPLSLDFTARRNGTSEMSIEAGLEPTKLSISDIGWEKPPGQPGSGKLDLLIQRDRIVEIRNLRFSAGDADVVGRIRFAADGKSVLRVDLERARVGRTDLRINATRDPRAWRVQVNGSALDLAEIKLDGPDAPAAPNRPRLAVEANVARVWITQKRALSDVAFRGERGPRWERALVTASGTDRTGKSDPFTLELTTDPAGKQNLRGRTVNAGAMLRSLGVTDKIVGGELDLTGTTEENTPGRPIALDLNVRAYRMVDEPAIARFLSTVLITGIADSMRGEGIGFDRLQARALLRDSVVEIIDMRTSGPALGIQARGKIEIAADRIEMEGTIVPANAVNSLFGRIPVVGEFLFGPGLFAARYTVRGPRSNPEVTINPLSALAPGVLRNIFGIFDGGTPPQPGQAPQNAPAGDSSP